MAGLVDTMKEGKGSQLTNYDLLVLLFVGLLSLLFFYLLSLLFRS